MITLPDGYVSKFSDEKTTHIIDPRDCSEQDFRELIIYTAFMNQNQLKALKEEVEGLKTAMNAKDEEVTDIREKHNDLCDKFDALKEDFKLLQSEAKLQSERVLHLERYTREWGLQFGNIQETTDENCAEIIENLFAKVGMPHVKIENAHRIGCFKVKPED